jgi:hypothetical protein
MVVGRGDGPQGQAWADGIAHPGDGAGGGTLPAPPHALGLTIPSP